MAINAPPQLERTGMQPVKASALQAAAITPSNATIFPAPFDAIYVGVAGNITVDMFGRQGENGAQNVTFANVPVGILPISVTRVYATGTSASSLTGLNW